MKKKMIVIFLVFLAYGQTKYDTFNAYWYSGVAELTSYTLEQARYGEIHKGHAVLIFVSEDFSRKKQVKLDYPIKDQSDKVSVLKLNFTKKFNTGIYPYSMMSSVFTPINIDQQQATLKVSTSSQEWCGHTFSQLNLNDDTYHFQLRSYFETEGDLDITLEEALLEDELWNLIRLNPTFLPIGDVSIIPGTFYSRLLHKDMAAKKATGSMNVIENNITEYTLRYDDIKRSLIIRFKSQFPFEIESWEETSLSGFGKNAKLLTTKAKKIKRLTIDYWSKNKNKDDHYRKELGLD